MSWKGTGQTKHSSCFGLLTTVTLGRLYFKRVHKPLAISHRRYNKPAADKEVDATFFPTVISNHRIYALRIRARSIAYRSNHFIWKNCCITIRQMFPSYSASGRQARDIRSLISAVNKHLGLCLLPISGNLSASQKKSVQTAHEKTVGLSSADMASLVLEIPSYLIVRQLIQRCPLTSRANAEKCSISLYTSPVSPNGERRQRPDWIVAETAGSCSVADFLLSVFTTVDISSFKPQRYDSWWCVNKGPRDVHKREGGIATVKKTSSSSSSRSYYYEKGERRRVECRGIVREVRARPDIRAAHETDARWTFARNMTLRIESREEEDGEGAV